MCIRGQKSHAEMQGTDSQFGHVHRKVYNSKQITVICSSHSWLVQTEEVKLFIEYNFFMEEVSMNLSLGTKRTITSCSQFCLLSYLSLVSVPVTASIYFIMWLWQVMFQVVVTKCLPKAYQNSSSWSSKDEFCHLIGVAHLGCQGHYLHVRRTIAAMWRQCIKD